MIQKSAATTDGSKEDADLEKLRKMYSDDYLKRVNDSTVKLHDQTLPANWTKELKKSMDGESYQHKSYQQWQKFKAPLLTHLRMYHEKIPLMACGDTRLDLDKEDAGIVDTLQTRLYTGITTLCSASVAKMLEREVSICKTNCGTLAFKHLDSIEFNSTVEANELIRQLKNRKFRATFDINRFITESEDLRESIAHADPKLAITDYQMAETLVSSLPDDEYWRFQKYQMQQHRRSAQEGHMTEAEYLLQIKTDMRTSHANRPVEPALTRREQTLRKIEREKKQQERKSRKICQDGDDKEKKNSEGDPSKKCPHGRKDGTCRTCMRKEIAELKASIPKDKSGHKDEEKEEDDAPKKSKNKRKTNSKSVAFQCAFHLVPSDGSVRYFAA
mmetsp:Transcript_10558/g.31781  ORF Transcript_10558/g.31781 Transcript_10558/m.31781 type:complete len:387 (+) Transcript_10558:484-1644(+)